MTAQPDIPAQVQEVQQMLEERENSFPRLVREKRIDPAVAERRLAALRAALVTLTLSDKIGRICRADWEGDGPPDEIVVARGGERVAYRFARVELAEEKEGGQ